LGEIITIRENAQGYIDNPEAQYTKQVKPDTTSSHVDVYRSPEKPKKDTTNFSEKYKPGAKY
jgi:stringent starvation protein B